MFSGHFPCLLIFAYVLGAQLRLPSVFLWLLYSSYGLHLHFDQPDKPLSNMKILILGKLSKNKDEIKSAVEELGGKVTTAVNKTDLCISSQSEWSS